jgi:ParG
VNTIKKPDMTGVKRVNINIPIDLHNSFKAASAARGENMTDVLLEFIENYVEKHGAAPARKGRRG